VLDGHPHALAFLGTVNSGPVTSLGMTEFGQSGELDDVYRHDEIDAETVVGAALDLLE
jgi:pyruvate dehydrogenase E1 component